MFSLTSKKILVLAALALCTTAYALDVEVQQGNAVRFPKGLKWSPMLAYNDGTGIIVSDFPDDESLQIWEDMIDGTRQELKTAVKIWKPIVAGNEKYYEGYVFKTIPSAHGAYFVSSAYTTITAADKPTPSSVGCDVHTKFGFNITCKTRETPYFMGEEFRERPHNPHLTPVQGM